MPEPAHILVITFFVTTPDADGGSLRLFRLMQLMVEAGHRVTFVATRPPPDENRAIRDAADREALRCAGVEVPEIPNIEAWLERHGPSVSLVFFSYLGALQRALGAVKRHAPRAVTVFDTVDLAHVRLYRMARTIGSQPILREALMVKRLELDALATCDHTIVVSESERVSLLKHRSEASIWVLPNVHDPEVGRAEFEPRRGGLFLGNFHHLANEDATLFLVRSIWPEVEKRLPDCPLVIVGAWPGEQVRALARPGVEVTGHVPDLDPWFERARVFVAPLRYGAGIKGKVLEALGRGVPSVLSPIAAEGMAIEEGKHALIAEPGLDFAAAVTRLHEDQELWKRLRAAGPPFVAEHYSFAPMRRSLGAFLEASLRPVSQTSR